MGLRGPKPKNKTLRLLDGSAAKDPQRVNQHEPPPVPGEPEMPAHLDAEGKTKWRVMCNLLKRMGLLSQDVGEPLATYCELYSLKMRCLKDIEESYLRENRERQPMRHPSTAIMLECQDKLVRLHAEFGLTPSGKSRIKANVQPPKDDLEEFLSSDKETG